VDTLVGYGPGPDGHDVAFAILFNGFDCGEDEVQAAQIEILTALMAGG